MANWSNALKKLGNKAKKIKPSKIKEASGKGVKAVKGKAKNIDWKKLQRQAKEQAKQIAKEQGKEFVKSQVKGKTGIDVDAVQQGNIRSSAEGVFQKFKEKRASSEGDDIHQIPGYNPSAQEVVAPSAQQQGIQSGIPQQFLGKFGSRNKGKAPWIVVLIALAIVLGGFLLMFSPFDSEYSVLVILVGGGALFGGLLFIIATRTQVFQGIGIVLKIIFIEKPKQFFLWVKKKFAVWRERIRREKELRKKSWDVVQAHKDEISPLLMESKGFKEQVKAVKIFAGIVIIPILSCVYALYFFFWKGRKIKKLIKKEEKEHEKERKAEKKAEKDKPEGFYSGGAGSGGGATGKILLVVGIIILILGGTAGFWFGYYKNTPQGQKISEQYLSFGTSTYSAERGSRGFFNSVFQTIKFAFSGDVEEIMKSREAESEYAQFEEIKTTMEEVKPYKNPVYKDSDISIYGYLSVEDGPEEGTAFEFEVRQLMNVVIRNYRKNQVCDSTLLSSAVSSIDSVLDENNHCNSNPECKHFCTDTSDWKCYIPGGDPAKDSNGNIIPNTFLFKNRYNQRVICSHSGIQDPKKDLQLSKITLIWKYWTQAMLEKRVYVFDSDYAALHKNPLKSANISRSSYESLSKAEKNIGFGAGISKDRDYMVTTPLDALKYGMDYIEIYNIIFTLRNKGLGDIVDLKDIEVWIPDSVNVVEEEGDFEVCGEKTDRGIVFKKYCLKKDVIDSFDSIGPALFRNFYLPVYVESSFIVGNEWFDSFTLTSKVYYKYRDEAMVDDVIKVDVGSSVKLHKTQNNTSSASEVVSKEETVSELETIIFEGRDENHVFEITDVNPDKIIYNFAVSQDNVITSQLIMLGETKEYNYKSGQGEIKILLKHIEGNDALVNITATYF